mgnify:CR=1 FL=1
MSDRKEHFEKITPLAKNEQVADINVTAQPWPSPAGPCSLTSRPALGQDGRSSMAQADL